MVAKAEQSTPVDTTAVFEALRAAGVDEEKAYKATYAIQDLAGWNVRESLAGFRKDVETRQTAQDAKFEGLQTASFAKLDSFRTEFDAKLESFRTEFDAKLEMLRTEVDAKLESFRTEFDAKLDGFRTEVDAKLESVLREVRFLKWLIIAFFAFWTLLLTAAALGWFGPRVIVREAQSAAIESAQPPAPPEVSPVPAVTKSSGTAAQEELVE